MDIIFCISIPIIDGLELFTQAGNAQFDLCNLSGTALLRNCQPLGIRDALCNGQSATGIEYQCLKLAHLRPRLREDELIVRFSVFVVGLIGSVSGADL